MLACAAGRAPVPADALRVGTSGDYPPLSIVAPDATEGFAGFDLEVARAWAEARGRPLAVVRFRWPELLEDLEAGRFDVAMSGVTVRPERTLAGRFSAPVLESGAVVLVPASSAFTLATQLDRPGIRLAVNAGGHLERVARSSFPRAWLLALHDNAAVPEALRAGSVEGVVTDTLEAPRWEARLGDDGRGGLPGGVRRLGPLTRDRKAYLVHADRGDLAEDLDAWLLAREEDGTLAALRARHLGAGAGPPNATALGALLSAADERLSLMPLVAEAKRATGRPVEDPTRETLVVESALAAVRTAALRTGVPPPAECAVAAVMRTLIEAAKEVQRAQLALPLGTAPASTVAPHASDLEAELRPALLRLDERIAWALVRLPPRLEPQAVREAVHDALRTPGVSEPARRAIADALVALRVARLRPCGATGAGARP